MDPLTNARIGFACQYHLATGYQDWLRFSGMHFSTKVFRTLKSLADMTLILITLTHCKLINDYVHTG